MEVTKQDLINSLPVLPDYTNVQMGFLILGIVGIIGVIFAFIWGIQGGKNSGWVLAGGLILFGGSFIGFFSVSWYESDIVQDKYRLEMSVWNAQRLEWGEANSVVERISILEKQAVPDGVVVILDTDKPVKRIVIKDAYVLDSKEGPYVSAMWIEPILPEETGYWLDPVLHYPEGDPQ